MVLPLQAEALDGRQRGDDGVRLVGGARPVVGVEFETRGTGAAVQAPGPRQAELLARPRVVAAAVGRSRRS